MDEKNKNDGGVPVPERTVGLSAPSPRHKNGSGLSTSIPNATACKERPILFSGAMVRAIIEGRKTQTRRIVKFGKDIKLHDVAGPYVEVGYTHSGATIANHRDTQYFLAHCPYGKPGDRLWVREAWGAPYCDRPGVPDGRRPVLGDDIRYRADLDQEYQWSDGSMPWRPSIHMPRWASRITLEVVSVRVERLNAISEEDAWAEGIQVRFCEAGKPCTCESNPVGEYADLWESINGDGAWNANPWVWVVEFRRVSTEAEIPQGGTTEELQPQADGVITGTPKHS